MILQKHPAAMCRSLSRRSLSALVVAALMASLTATSQEKTVFPHSVFWHKTEINEIFPSGWGVGLDFVYRRKNEMGQGSMFDARLRESIRPWLNYQVTPSSRFSLSPVGYMMTHEYVGKPEDVDRLPYHELRSTMQFFHHDKFLDGKLMQTWRYRYELRWQERAGTDEYRFFQRFRIRYRLRYVLNGEDFYRNNTAYLMASTEIGLNFGQNVYLNTFNQNRLYAGLGYRFFQSLRAELRYVDRIRTRGATGFEFDHGRGLMLAFYIDQLSGIDTDAPDLPSVRFSD